MCLSPIRIYNKSKKLDIYRGDRLTIEVPCGKCCECRQNKAKEYIARSYGQWRETEDKGGFTYFETLTYAPEFVPKYRGQLVFSQDDYKKFFKRLRINLERAGYEVKENLKYFFVSEYGGKTHRPHYHVIFYSTVPNLTAHILRKFIKDSWQLGIIDDARTISKRIVNGMGAINYVAKYVNKDDDFVKELDRRIQKAKRFMKPEDFDRIYSKEVLRNIYPFHRQSQGFGLYLLKLNDYNEMFDTGMITIPDKKYVKKHIPMYLQRKLWYTTVYDIETKTARYVLNEEGLRRKMDRLDKSIVLLAKRYKDIIDNLDAYKSDVINNTDYIKEQALQYLAGRSWTQFAAYLLCYKGRFAHTYTNIADYREFYRGSLDKFDGRILYDNHLFEDAYVTTKRKKVVDSPDGYIYLKNKDGHFVYEDYKMHYSYVTAQTIRFKNGLTHQDTKDRKSLETMVIDEHTFIEFEYFDKLYELLKILTTQYGKLKQDAYDAIQEHKSKMKLLNKQYA